MTKEIGKEGGEERGRRRRTGGKKEENCGHHTSLGVFLVNLTAGKEERCRSLVFSFSHSWSDTQCNKSMPANTATTPITSFSHWVRAEGETRRRWWGKEGDRKKERGERGGQLVKGRKGKGEVKGDPMRGIRAMKTD